MNNDVFVNYITHDYKNKLLIIICEDSQQRKLLYEFIETFNGTKIKKFGLRTKFFSSSIRRRYKKCFNCGCKCVVLDHYNYGTMKNNKDEWYSGECQECGETVSWEPNYDSYDDIRTTQKNNMIVIGNYIMTNAKYTTTPTQVTKQEFDEVVSKCKYFIIDPPNKLLNKRKLQEYINVAIEKLI